MFGYATCEAILNLPVVIRRQIGDSALRFVRNMSMPKDRRFWMDLCQLISLLIIFVSAIIAHKKKYKIAVFNYAKQRANLEREIIALAIHRLVLKRHLSKSTQTHFTAPTMKGITIKPP